MTRKIVVLISTAALIVGLVSGFAAGRQFSAHNYVRAKLELKTATLDLQEKCAKQALKEFKNYWEDRPMADFRNHYNVKLNKCFMQVQSLDLHTAPGRRYFYKILYDAFEGKDYAEYAHMSEKNKADWEVPPFMCKVTLLSGEERICHSPEEFDALVKQYME